MRAWMTSISDIRKDATDGMFSCKVCPAGLGLRGWDEPSGEEVVVVIAVAV